MTLQEALDAYDEAETILHGVVDTMFPRESVVKCEKHSGQFAIVLMRSDSPPGFCRLLLEHGGVVEWPAYSLERKLDRSDWPTWVRKKIASRKRLATQRRNERESRLADLR